MKQIVTTISTTSQLCKGIILIFLLHLVMNLDVAAQCGGFFITVDTDPPYLTYCPGDTVAVFPIISGGTGPFTYQWDSGGTDSVDYVQALDIGWYSACVTVTDANGCVAVGCKHIKPTFWNFASYNGFPQCEGQAVTLSVSPQPPDNTFLWTTGETTNSISVTTPGTYTVTVTNTLYGCVEVVDLTPQFLDSPIPELIGPGQICVGQTATVEVTDPGQYLNFSWSPSGANTSSITIDGPGTYGVTVTDNQGCTGTDEITIGEVEGTLPQLQAPEFLCAEDTGLIEVTNTSDLVSYEWNTGETTSSISGTAPASYTVTVTDVNGCLETGEIIIDLYDVTIPEILGDDELCVTQETTQLTVDPAFVDYTWSTGETTQSIIVEEDGIYQVTVTDNNGCTTIGEHQLDAAPIPEPLIQLPGIPCSNTSVDLWVEGAGGPYISHVWSNGATGSQITVTQSGTFTVTVTNESGCTAESPQETVIIGDGPSVSMDISVADCDGSVVLSATGDGDYLWSTGETTQSINVADNGTYSVTLTDENGCIGVAEEWVTIPGIPSVDITGSQAICDGASGELSATGGFEEYLWSDGQLTPDIQVMEPGTYTVTVTDSLGCTAEASHTIDVAATPDPLIEGPPGLCNDGSATYQLNSSYAEIMWSTGDNTPSVVINDPGTLSVVVTNDLGCTGEDSVVIESYPAPAVTIAGPSSVCTGSSAILEVSGIYQDIIWNTGATSSSIEVNASGTFEVTVTDMNGCSASTVHVIETGTSLSPVIATSAPPCSDTAYLTAGTGYASYLWSNGETTPGITVASSGNYSVTVSDDTGCSGEGAVDVEISQPPQINISGPASACTGEQVMLEAPSGFASYLWSTGDTAGSITVTSSGVYELMVTDINGCTATSSHEFERFDMPEVEISGPSTICTGTSATLQVAGTYQTIEWSTGETTPEITVQAQGTYEVVVTDNNGCSASDIREIEISDSLDPGLSLSGDPCEGTIVIEADPGFETYLWSDGSTEEVLTAAASGEYSVTVTDAGGCTGEGTIEVSLPQPPNVEIGGPQAICQGEQATLVASPGFVSYAWSTGATTESIVVSTSGNYLVVVTDQNGCTANDSIQFELLPSPEITITGPETVCSNETTQLSITGTFDQVEWSTGESTNEISVGQSGSYAVTVFDVNGCSAMSAHEIEVLQSDTVYSEIETCSAMDTGIVEQIMTNQAGCDSVIIERYLLAPSLNTSVELTACPGGVASYQDEEIPVGSSKTFLYTASNGCDSVVSVSVFELPPMEFDVSLTPACTDLPDGEIEIDILSGAEPWQFAIDDQELQSTPVFAGLWSGTYQLRIIDANSCTHETPVVLPEAESTVVQFEHQTISCTNPSVVIEPEIISGDSSKINWFWSDDSSQPSISVDLPGDYTVIIDDGCEVQTHTVHVNWASEVSESDLFYIPNVFSPNEDGINDLFELFPSPDITILDFEFRIFDRWGNLMFGTDQPEESWDGLFEGLRMQPGVYVWYMKSQVELCGMRKIDILRKGDVTLVR